MQYHYSNKQIATDQKMAGPASPGDNGPSYAPPKVPEGWIAQWDANEKKFYFVNRYSGVSQWEVPTEPAPIGRNTPSNNNNEHPYGQPQVITHPDGTQTVKHPDGTMEPVLPPGVEGPAGTRGIDGPTGDRGLGVSHLLLSSSRLCVAIG